ncbi:MAG: hypothetical protein WD851_23235 [Pirellulales bacterium]
MEQADFSKRLVLQREAKLAAYVSLTGALGASLAPEAHAVIVANTTPQPFGINGQVNIDFNRDGQTDLQVDHDRYNLNGFNLDYLQIDKNDTSSHLNPFPYSITDTFPLNGTQANGDHGYIAQQNEFNDLGLYPRALPAGELIGPESAVWDFQEGDGFGQPNTWIRANRLIDEDRMQIDASIGRNVALPEGTPGWVGLNGEVRYLGVRIDLNDAVRFGLNQPTDLWWYGWIGIQIDNENDATGVVTGYAYESELGMPIMAGDTGPVLVGDYNGDGAISAADYTIWRDTLGSTTDLRADGNLNTMIDQGDYSVWAAKFGTAGSGLAAAVPEPGSIVLAALTGLAILAAYAVRKWFP